MRQKHIGAIFHSVVLCFQPSTETLDCGAAIKEQQQQLSRELLISKWNGTTELKCLDMFGLHHK